MCNIEGEHIRGCLFVIITSLLFTLFTVKVITSCITKDDNTNNIDTSDIIKKNLKDSIIVITVKENEEVNIVRNASNDSTLIIFKKLVSE